MHRVCRQSACRQSCLSRCWCHRWSLGSSYHQRAHRRRHRLRSRQEGHRRSQADLRLFKSLPPAATATLLATTAIISILGSRPNSTPASVRIFFFFHFALLFLSHQNPTQPSAHPHAVFVFPPLLSVVAFVPAHTYGSHAYFWNLVSYAFVETNLLLFVIDALAMLTFLPIFERMWGVTETACFFLASAVCAALLLLVSIVALFALTLDWSVLQVSIDVAVACAPLIFLESSPSTSGSPLQPALSSCSSPRYTRTKAFLPSQAKTCPGLGLRRYHSACVAASVVSRCSSQALCSCVLHAQDHQRWRV